MSQALHEIATDNELWAVFHENSKNSSISIRLPPEEVARRMATFEPTLAYRAISLPLPREDPPPRVKDFLTLLRTRESARAWTSKPIPLPFVSSILEATYGERANGRRVVPSAGALYPLEVFVCARDVSGVEPGIYHFNQATFGLESVNTGALAQLPSAFIQPEIVDGASCLLVIAAVFERSVFKYGDRGYRYALLEAGHAAQNALLMATILGVQAVCLGGFLDHRLDRLLGLDGIDVSSLYAVAFGFASADL